MRKITVTIDENGKVQSSDSACLGYSGEHNAAEIVIAFADIGKSAFVDADYFRLVIDGRYSDEIALSDGKFYYTVPQECMNPPLVHCQLVGFVSDAGEPVMIAKSEVFSFGVDYSEIPMEKVCGSPDVFERTLDKCREAAVESQKNADAAADSASQSEESAQTAMEAAGRAENLRDECEDYSLKASGYAALASSCATEAARSVEQETDIVARIGEAANLPQNVANAVKGCIEGTAAARDVSPIGHELSIRCDTRYTMETEQLGTMSGMIPGETHRFSKGYHNLSVHVTSKYGNGYIMPYFGPEEIWYEREAACKVDFGKTEDGSGTLTGKYEIEGGMIRWEFKLTFFREGNEAYCEESEISGSAWVPEDTQIRGIYTGKDDADGSYMDALFDGEFSTEVMAGSAAEVAVTGLNLLPLQNSAGITVGGIRYETLNGDVRATGMINGNSTDEDAFREAFRFRLPNGTYRFSCGAMRQDFTGDTTLTAYLADAADGTVLCSVDCLKGSAEMLFSAEEDRTYYLGFRSGRGTGEALLLDSERIPVMLSAVPCCGYESCKPLKSAFADGDGYVTGLRSVSPHMTVLVYGGGAHTVYNRDTNVVVRELKSQLHSGLIIEDETNNVRYFAAVKLGNGKPFIEYEEV